MNTRQPTLLIVDDDLFNQEIISAFLTGCDYQLVIRDNGQAALDTLRAAPDKFDAVLLDRVMPGLDGIEVLQQIKQDPKLQILPVIMQTASSSPEQIAEGLQYGAFYYLTKPFGQQLLKAVTATAIRDRFERQRSAYVQTAQHNVQGLLTQARYTLRTRQEAHALATVLSELCPSPDSAYMGLVELMLNAVEHGNLAITYDEKTQLLNEDRLAVEIDYRLTLPDYRDRYATVEFVRHPERLIFTITDQGSGFNWHDYLEMSLERMTHNHGRGIAMSRSIAFSALEYLGIGNCVVATIAITLV